MRIFSKKAYRFDHPANQEEPVRVQALSFANVPEWVKESGMFKLAYSAGEIELPQGKTEESKIEKAANEPKRSKKKPESGE